MWSFFKFHRSTRTPSVVSKKKSLRGDDESDDLTKDMEEPSPEPNVQEVHIPKNSMYNYYIMCAFYNRILPKMSSWHTSNVYTDQLKEELNSINQAEMSEHQTLLN